MSWLNRTFGFIYKRKDLQQKPEKEVISKQQIFPTSEIDNTSGVIDNYFIGDFTQSTLSMNDFGSEKIEFLKHYRRISTYPDVEKAIDDIVNESIVIDNNSLNSEHCVVKLNLDSIDKELIDESLKKKIQDEFKTILNLLDFSSKAQDIFRRWYIDGEINFQIMADSNNQKNGIKKLSYIPPQNVRKFKRIEKIRDEVLGNIVVKELEEFFAIKSPYGQIFKLSSDAIVRSNSGIINENGTILSYLHKAIKPANQLMMVEDAAVVYRLARAPERKAFYIDVGNLPHQKANSYLNEIMQKYKDKLVYNSTTGEISNGKNYLSVMEDYWLTRRGDGRATEIQQLPGAANLGDIEDIIYFQKKLYKSLHIPVSRLEADAMFAFGKPSEITRDEVRLNKFINKLRIRFNELFVQLLRTQLLMKNLIEKEKLDEICNQFVFDYLSDSYFTELKQLEIITNRLLILNDINNFKNIYFSKECIQKNILQMDDEKIKEMEKQIEDDKKKEPPPFEQDFSADGQPQGGFQK